MRAKFVNEKFTEGGDPIKDMGIGVFISKRFDNTDKAAKYMYANLAAILRRKLIPADIIYPIEYKNEKGLRLAYNEKYTKKLFHFVMNYVQGDTTFKGETLRKLNEILLMAGYPFKHPKTEK